MYMLHSMWAILVATCSFCPSKQPMLTGNPVLQIQYAAPSLGDPDVVRDDSKTLFVRNLPFRASEQDIREYFAQAGPVVDVRRQAADDGE